MTMTELVLSAPINLSKQYFSDQSSCYFGQGPCPLLWALTSPITVLANHSTVSSVKCSGPRPAPMTDQPTTVLQVP